MLIGSFRSLRYVTTGNAPFGFFFQFVYNANDGTVPDFYDADGSYESDVILPPVRSANGRGIILLKTVLLETSYYNPTDTPIVILLRVYKKGNMPKDDATDAPDYSVSFTALKGEKIIQFPPLLSEEFILRLTWNIPIEEGDVLYNNGALTEAKQTKQGIVSVKRIAVETEEYGDIRNVWGESV